jgi:glycosyltransferase involved in cell wall biosynthesis
MVTTSYPRFPGDAIATFMEPIATGVAALGHRVHLVAPWTPRWQRGVTDQGVDFHLYRYAPVPSMNTFGYAAGLSADVRLRVSAVAAAPLALAAGWTCTRRVARETASAIVHAHWVIPSGAIAAAAAGDRPLVISLHGSDVFVAERHRVVGAAARRAFARASWVTACSADLRDRAVNLGASPERISIVPYGVDTDRFAPSRDARQHVRARLGIASDAPLAVAVGRLVEKKGFKYLIEATAIVVRQFPEFRLVIAGEGDLAAALKAQAAAAGLREQFLFPGVVSQQEVPALLAAADLAAAPSIRDDAGNVDGLPNTVLEMMASGTPLVTTTAGGIGSVVTDGVTARVVPERDATALAGAMIDLLGHPAMGDAIGASARALACREHGWRNVAQTFDQIYAAVSTSRGRS